MPPAATKSKTANFSIKAKVKVIDHGIIWKGLIVEYVYLSICYS